MWVVILQPEHAAPKNYFGAVGSVYLHSIPLEPAAEE